MAPEKKLEASQAAPPNLESSVNEGSTDVDTGLFLSKVSEAVGEAPSETISQSSGKKDDTTQKKNTSITGKILKLLGSNQKKTTKKLPTLVVQKQKTRKAISKVANNLIKEAYKIENSKNFSAEKLEKVILKIRHLQKILAEMFTYTSLQIENLYRKFVTKENI